MERLRPVAATTEPTVSVVIPCYKYGHYLPGAVSSALDQVGVNVDVLIIDDASPDDSGEVAKTLAATEPRVSCIIHEVNKGHIATYNEGLARAGGDYVVLLSADDLLTEGCLARSTSLLESRKDLAFVYGYAQSVFGEVPAARTSVRNWSVWTGKEWIERICHRGNGLVVSPEVVMRRSVMDDVGGFDADHPHAADFKLWLHAACRGGVGRVNGPDQAFYRVHGQNMHLTDYSGVMTDVRERRRAFETFFREEGVAHPDIAPLDEVSRRSQAREAVSWAIHTYDAGERVEAVEVEAAEEYVAFALEVWPPIRKSGRWRRYDRRARGKVPRVERVLSNMEWDIRHRLRWRRWRRYGT